MYSSKCVSCNAVIMTKTDQSTNSNFRCKSCAKNKKILDAQQDIDTKYGPKVIPGWHIPFLDSYLPDYITQNDVRCDKCFKRFYSNTVPTHCPLCFQNIPAEHVCVKCNTHCMVTPKYYTKHDSMCITCYNSSIFPFVCSYCTKTFLDSHNTYNAFNESVCHSCRDTIEFKNKLLMNYEFNNNLIVNRVLNISDNRFIDITYKPTYKRTYSCFYCENKNDDNDFINLITKRFPLLNEFTNSDNIMANTDFNRYYHLPYELLCDNGCERIVYTIDRVDFC